MASELCVAIMSGAAALMTGREYIPRKLLPQFIEDSLKLTIEKGVNSVKSALRCRAEYIASYAGEAGFWAAYLLIGVYVICASSLVADYLSLSNEHFQAWSVLTLWQVYFWVIPIGVVIGVFVKELVFEVTALLALMVVLSILWFVAMSPKGVIAGSGYLLLLISIIVQFSGYL